MHFFYKARPCSANLAIFSPSVITIHTWAMFHTLGVYARVTCDPEGVHAMELGQANRPKGANLSTY